jgi:hypothetical protein
MNEERYKYQVATQTYQSWKPKRSRFTNPVKNRKQQKKILHKN